MLKAPRVQTIEVGSPVLVLEDHLAIEYRIPLQASGFLHNERIAFGPVRNIQRIEVHETGADVNLKSIAVVLDLVDPMCSPVGGFLERVGREG
jgi:hypothetical protein